MKKLPLYMMLAVVFSFTSCRSCTKPQPIPKDKNAFIGVWYSNSGFMMNIKSTGTADLTQIDNSQDPDNIKLNIGVTPEYAKGMPVEFRGDSILIISQPTVRGKEYRIERSPFSDGDTTKMILNGVVLIKQK